jgi:hypothetical protein
MLCRFTDFRNQNFIVFNTDNTDNKIIQIDNMNILFSPLSTQKYCFG